MTDKEYKSFPAYSKAVNDQGLVEHLVAIFGNIDDGGDIIHPGAFSKTIAERASKIRCLDNHQTGSLMDVVGKPVSMREIGRDELPPELLQRFPDATGALSVKTQFLMNTPEGAGAFERIKAGAVDEYSIGYDALDADYSEAVKNGEKVTVRNLRTIKLWEYSPVIFAMNPATATLSAKANVGLPDVTAKADYPWEDCMADQMERYGDEETARRVCGAIRAANKRYDEITSEERAAIEKELDIRPAKSDMRAVTFSQAITNEILEQQVWENRWKYDQALNDSLRSIACDENLDTAQKLEMARQSIAQFGDDFRQKPSITAQFRKPFFVWAFGFQVFVLDKIFSILLIWFHTSAILSNVTCSVWYARWLPHNR